jgi:hypothetical protein
MKAAILAVILFLTIAFPAVGAESSSSPTTWLWAWQRNEDLSGVTRTPIGIAYLAQTLTLRGRRVLTTPRDQSLRLPSHAVLMPVTRIEVSRASTAQLTDEEAETIANLVVRTLAPRAVGVQIDFDARQSERAFYLKILSATRQKLPNGAKLSMTALASWCLFDCWAEKAPVDEVVPMFFSMGADSAKVLSYLQDGRQLCSTCRSAVGVSADDLPAASAVLQSKAASERTSTYVFTSKPWTTPSLRTALSLPVPRRP